MTRHAVLAFGWLLGTCLLPARAQANSDQLAELKRMSVDELLNVEVTSVSRREEGSAPAPRRPWRCSRAKTCAAPAPTACRRRCAWCPGCTSQGRPPRPGCVSARGFSSVNSEKLLVLSDTRSIYTPLFSGVTWDVQDYLLEDVERVEVIRGPGAALWGSNAVNGVVNITTRSARDTHGDYLEAGTGDFERVILGARHGGETDGGKHYRVFARYFDRDGTGNPLAEQRGRMRNLGHLGFRMDWGRRRGDRLDRAGRRVCRRHGPACARRGSDRAPGTRRAARFRRFPAATCWRAGAAPCDGLRPAGARLLRLHASRRSQLHRHAAYRRSRPAAALQRRAIIELLWGLAGRLTSNRNRSRGIFAVEPEDSDDLLWSGFVQDQISLSDSVAVTIGTKFEHNDFSGFEVQPSIRASWAPDPDHSLWLAASRAVRVPTRLERDVDVDATRSRRATRCSAWSATGTSMRNGSSPTKPVIAGRHREQLWFDLALFHNDYDRAGVARAGEPFIDGTGRTIVPVLNRNLGSGRSHGAELLMEWQPLENWRLTASYSSHRSRPGILGPRYQSQRLARWHHAARHDGIALADSRCGSSRSTRSSAITRAFAACPPTSRARGSTRTPLSTCASAGRLNPQWRLSLVGQNLLDDEHVEFGTPAARGALARAA